ncbi:HAD-IA family hydrolase [Micromonospora sp. NPDC049044]|uniref:HAD-IA family hydrolase n=1 Tax=unclassified Micromonospora TaxID=2617518 RepID=UPI0033FF7DBF
MTSLARISGAAVLFDVDGVLVDSYAAYRRIWDRWALHRSLDPVIVWAHTHGRRPIDTITVVAPHLDAEAEYRLVRDFMADEGDAFPVYADAPATLEIVRDQPWGVVTSGRALTVRQRLRAGGLPDPPVLVDSTQVTHGKPDPEGYLRAADLLRTSPERCLVIEDAPAGIAAARAAGMTVIALTTTHTAAQLADAHHVTETLGDAMPIIGNWLVVRQASSRGRASSEASEARNRPAAR